MKIEIFGSSAACPSFGIRGDDWKLIKSSTVEHSDHDSKISLFVDVLDLKEKGFESLRIEHTL